MGGGSVAGYSLPLGAKPRNKKKKKKVYMEPHMHQDGTGGDSGDSVADGEELEEISAMGGQGGGSVQGYGRKVDEDEEPSLIREKEAVVERVLNYLLQHEGL